MSDQLTKEQQEFAHKAATTLFNCLMLTESHAAAFSQDPNRLAEANERSVANAPRPSSLRFEELEEHIKLNEELIKSMEGCTAFDDRVKVLAACNQLSQLLYHRADLMGNDVKVEVFRAVTQLVSDSRIRSSQSANSREASFNVENLLPRGLNQFQTTNPSAVVQAGITGRLASTQDDSDDSDEYPMSMHAPALLRSRILGRPRVKVTDTEVLRYKQNLDSLVQQIFVPSGEDEEEEPFKVFAILSTSEDKIFYLVYLDVGNEALAHPSEQFFELLSTSERVI